MYFLCLSIFESDIVLSFSMLAVAENQNSSDQHVFNVRDGRMLDSNYAQFRIVCSLQFSINVNVLACFANEVI